MDAGTRAARTFGPGCSAAMGREKTPCTRRRSTAPSGTPAVSSGQAPSRHTRALAYRCFLPDLTGFTRSRCTRPGPQRHLQAPDPKAMRPREGIQPRYSGLRVQGTATSPLSTANSTILGDSLYRAEASGVKEGRISDAGRPGKNPPARLGPFPAMLTVTGGGSPSASLTGGLP